MKDKIKYRTACTEQDFENGKKLFEEYAHTLNVDLSFQNFSKELETIDKQYNHPEGALLLVQDGKNAVGCAGVRKLDDEIAELKRMYVQNAYRGYQIGLRLLERSIELARELGYQKIRLDTLENMRKAQELYRSFGFYEIPSYRFNPLTGTIYMEKVL
jgi:putative acetyltransferase